MNDLQFRLTLRAVSSLVRDFQREIVQSSKSTTELLRTAKVISVKLGLNDIESWISSELNGYSNGDNLPDYRWILSGGELQAFNPYRGWISCGRIDKPFPVSQPVVEIEDLAMSEIVCVPLSGVEKYNIQGSAGMDISSWRQRVSFSPLQMKGLVSAVRDKLLDWALELEKRGITGEGMAFDESERKLAHSGNFHIQNFAGVLGNVSHSSVQIYDYSSLHQTLKQQSVPQAERNELENLMDELKKGESAKRSGLIEKAKAWLVRNEKFLGASASIVRRALGLEINE